MSGGRTAYREDVDPAGLEGAVAGLLRDGWRLALVAGHDDGDGFRVVYSFLRPVGQRRELVVRLPHDRPHLPSLAGLSYPAGRFERELRDLFGIEPIGHPMPRRLVRHGHWPSGWHPMRRDAGPMPDLAPDVGSYPFVHVQGDGVYEIPVGPIHAGIIEPGHFRFSVVGETILRMKARLWFVHRGMERLFEGRTPDEAIELAERVSGDTAVGHTVALVQAVEEALGIEVSPAVAARRAVLLELERLYNHVADLGMIANDVGFGIAHIHTQRLREKLLRHNAAVTGHRLLRGGVGVGSAQWATEPDLALVAEVAAEVAEIVALTLDHSVVLDRFTGTAVLPAELARNLGTLGYVARASGLTVDARADHPQVDLGPGFTPVTQEGGDVLARYAVRASEFAASAALLPRLIGLAAVGGEGPVGAMGLGGERTAYGMPEGEGSGPAAGLGVVEAWRGTLCHRVELGPDGRLTRVKIVDPSFFNWPALPVALADTIVPDFPLANKSFNQSYAGNDL
ncbi:MAG: NADH-quinone oxidoreductase subunit C [Candidatus Phosphoribacter baldrii]